MASVLDGELVEELEPAKYTTTESCSPSPKGGLIKGVPIVKSPKGYILVTLRLPLSHSKATFNAYRMHTPFAESPSGARELSKKP